jgi:uncharacterized protein YggT (Ycf19 family)
VISAVILMVINVYMLVIIADAIVSYLPQYKNKEWAIKLSGLAGYSLSPVRRILPPNSMNIDISPFIVLMVLSLLKVLW